MPNFRGEVKGGVEGMPHILGFWNGGADFFFVTAVCAYGQKYVRAEKLSQTIDY